MKHSYCFFLLSEMLNGFRHGMEGKGRRVADMRYVADGCEGTVEYQGQFYRVTVKPEGITGPVYT